MKRIKILTALAVVFSTVAFTISSNWYGATYPGGRVAMEAYFRDSLRYPEKEKSEGKEEVVQVTFEISKEGVAQNPQITSLFGGSPGFDAEIKRLVADMPKWEPSLDRKGKPYASSEYTIVQFRLPDSLLKPLPEMLDTAMHLNAEEMPRFQGGEGAFQTYLSWMIRYPQMEKEHGKDGTVYIYFEVTQKGSITNVKCQKGVQGAPGLAKEAIRVIADMPRWIPGKVNGKPVRVGMTVPIRFKLQ